MIPTTKKELGQRTDLEYAPGKLVAAVKAPDGRRKSRVVVCGNCVESSLDHQQSLEDMGDEASSPGTSYGTKRKTWDCYAVGIDGLTIRAAVRKAGDQGWGGAITDVKTAFLLAPRKSSSLWQV